MKKFTKIISLILAAAIAMTVLCLPAGAWKYDESPTSITSGKTYSLTFPTNTTRNYKISSSGSTTLRIDIDEQVMPALYVRVFNSSGDLVPLANSSVTVGRITNWSANYWYGEWNSDIGRFDGSYYYNIGSGTYYIALERGSNSSGTGSFKFTATFPAKELSKDLMNRVGSGIDGKSNLITSGKTYNMTYKTSTTEYYKFKVDKSCTLKVEIDEQTIPALYIGVYDMQHNLMPLTDSSATVGKITKWSDNYWYGEWNSDIGRFDGVFKYKLAKGVYYLCVERGSNSSGDGKFKLTASFPETDTGTRNLLNRVGTGVDGKSILIDSGNSYSRKFKTSTTEYYKIYSGKSGTLTVDMTADIPAAYIGVYDFQYKLVPISNYSASVGKITKWSDNYWYGEWNSDKKSFSGKFSYELGKGIYYIAIERGSNSSGNGNISFKASWSQGKFSGSNTGSSGNSGNNNTGNNNNTGTNTGNNGGNTVSDSSSGDCMLILYLDVGDKIQIGELVGGSEGKSISYSSSNSKVVKVTSKGKLKAVGEGAATITVKCGSAVVKVYVIVED